VDKITIKIRYTPLVIMILLGTIFVPYFVSAFYGTDLETINKIILEQESLTQKVNSKIIEDQVIENLIISTENKKDVAGEKENAYDKAINDLKWWVAGIGFILASILIFFGYWEDKKLIKKKEELSLELDRKKADLCDMIKEKSEWLNKEDEQRAKGSIITAQEELISFRKVVREENNKQIRDLKEELRAEIYDYIKKKEEKCDMAQEKNINGNDFNEIINEEEIKF